MTRLIDALPTNALHGSSVGIVANSTRDQTAAINAALKALKPGQALVLAPGSYIISSSLLMHSGTELYGPGATIRAAATWLGTVSADPAVATGYALVANANFAATTITDTKLTVDGVAFDFGKRTDGGAHAIRFRQVSDVQIINCSFNGGDDGTALLACDHTLVKNCTATNTLNAAFDHWEGTSNAVVTGCTATVASGMGILFTGVGSKAGDDHVARNVTATNNVITGPFGVEGAGILADALSQKSAVQGVTFTGNTINGVNSAGSGIGVLGNVSNTAISGNTIENVAGPAIFGLADAWNPPKATKIGGNRLLNTGSLPTGATAGKTADVSAAVSTGSSGQIWLSGPQSMLTTTANSTVVVQSGSATVTAGGAGSQSDTVYAVGGTLSFFNGHSQSYVYGGDASIKVSGGAGGGLFQGGSAGGNRIAAGTGAATILGGGAGDVLQAGGSAGDLIMASAGNTTLLGGGSTGDDVLMGGTGNDSIVAGKGKVSISGGGGMDTIVAGAGSDVIQMSTDGGRFVAGTGSASVLGGGAVGSGADLYTFTKGHAGGTDLVVGFRAGVDHISLTGYGSLAVANAVSAAASGGGSSRLTLSDGTQITLIGIAKVTAGLFS